MNINLLRFDLGENEGVAQRQSAQEARALDDLRCAERLDPDSGAAQAIVGLIHQYNWREDDALHSFARALSLRPNDPEVLGPAGFLHAVAGAAREAVVLGQRAVDVDPLGPLARHYMALIQLQTGDVERALIAYRSMVQLTPTRAIVHALLASLENLSGNHEAGVAQARIAERLLPDDLNLAHFSMVICAYGGLGCSDDAQRLFSDFQTLAQRRYVGAAPRAFACLGVGDRHGALAWLKRAASDPTPYAAYFSVLSLKGNWPNHPLLARPEFVRARRQLGRA